MIHWYASSLYLYLWAYEFIQKIPNGYLTVGKVITSAYSFELCNETAIVGDWIFIWTYVLINNSCYSDWWFAFLCGVSENGWMPSLLQLSHNSCPASPYSSYFCPLHPLIDFGLGLNLSCFHNISFFFDFKSWQAQSNMQEVVFSFLTSL